MSTFRDLLKKIRGLQVKYNNGTARVEEVYWETERAMILLSEGTTYTNHDPYRGIQLTYVSDGYDRIIVDVSELEKQN